LFRLNYERLTTGAIILGFSTVDYTVAALGIVLILEATRRCVGLPIVIIALCALIYGIFGPYMPIFSHRGFSWDRMATEAFFSSDLVFDGLRRASYIESDPVAPLNMYGRSKVEAEQWVLDLLPTALVIRTSAFFGPWDEYNFVTYALRTLSSGQRFVAANDAVVSPTYVPDLVHASLDLLIDREQGVWHLANTGAISWANLAQHAAELAGVDPGGLEGCPTACLGLPAQRPLYSVLSSERGILLPSLDDALARYLTAYPVGSVNSYSIIGEAQERTA
jgi:dTDP-4-dehydrorhamnose reductase